MNDKFNLLQHIKTGDSHVVVWMLNIGVEQYWNNSKKICMDHKEQIVVNHVEELNLLITKKQDYLILRKKPDSLFLKNLVTAGFEIPHILCPSVNDEHKSISELVLNDQELLDEITTLSKRKKVYFVPYGVSYTETLIAQRCGMHLIGGTHEKNKIVNNKIFAKNVADVLGLNVARGIVCHNRIEISEAYEELRKSYTKVVVKMPCNSSGQGIWVIDDEKRLHSVLMIIERVMKIKKNDEWLVEGWLEKKVDLNLQVYVSEDGEVETFSVKEQIVNNVLYVGSVMPARITKEQELQCKEYGVIIGKYLYDQGFTGVFGIDALIGSNDEIVPIIEINGRFTLSTYVSFVQSKFVNKCIYAFYERFHTNEQFDYSKMQEVLDEANLLYDGEKGTFIYNSATLNAGYSGGNVRTFCMAIGDDFEQTEVLKKRICGLFCKIY